MAPATKKKPKAEVRKPVAKKRQPARRAKAKAPTSKRVPIAVVRALAAALERDGDAWQVQSLTDVLAKIGDARAPAAAASVLGHTRKGTSLARAYLKALGGDTAAADEVV